jgi:hypothetical protein
MHKPSSEHANFVESPCSWPAPLGSRFLLRTAFCLDKVGEEVGKESNWGVNIFAVRPSHLEVSELLRDVRCKAQLSQIELAVRLGKVKEYVYTAENATTKKSLNLLQIWDWCTACDISMEDFLGQLQSRARVK